MKIVEGVTKETACKLFELQKRCICCGSTYNLHVHHRVTRSEGSAVLTEFLLEKLRVYCICYNISFFEMWGLHDIQNLSVVCQNCHEYLHRGNDELRQWLKNSFTHPISGFQIPFYKNNKLLW